MCNIVFFFFNKPEAPIGLCARQEEGSEFGCFLSLWLWAGVGTCDVQHVCTRAARCTWHARAGPAVVRTYELKYLTN